MTRRLIDALGHAWPITGYTCMRCGWPLNPALARDRVHPTCNTAEDCTTT